MKCYDCGELYNEISGSLPLHDDFIGDYIVQDVHYYHCGKCGKILFPTDTILKIESIENDSKAKLINKIPVSEFVFANDAADMLGITKQAFNKNHRIKNGFIYSITIGNKKLYNKKSIQLFKQNGDGRFNLSHQPRIENPKLVIVSNRSFVEKSLYQSDITSHNPYISYHTSNRHSQHGNA
jgi:hypothetical protein